MKIYLAGYGKGGGEIADDIYFKALKSIGVRKLFSFYRDTKSMKIYFAGGENRSWLKAINEAGGSQSLYSYFYLLENNKKIDPFIQDSQKTQNDIFLDSGGFSAWSRDAEINIDQYIDFIKKYGSYLTSYAQLDVIGDEKGTEKNLNYMIKRNTDPIPVFHFKGSIDRLKDLSDQFDYIALGGLVPLARQKPKLMKWLDRCFSVIRDNAKVHGFGMTGMDILKRYPFYSVDSTSWLGGSMRAEVYKFDRGSMITNSTTKKQKITSDSYRFKDFDSKKWFDRVVQNAIEWQKAEKYLTELWKKRGITYE